MGVVNNSKGALPEIAKRISSVASDIVTVRTATVFTDSVAPAQTEVVLDNDPSQTPINALGLNFSLAKGTRVVCLAYPPRGLVVLGAIADSSGGSVSEITLLCDDTVQEMIIDCESIQTLTSAVGSTLWLNRDGGNIRLFDDATGNPELVVCGTVGSEVHINTNQVWATTAGAAAGSALYLNHTTNQPVYIMQAQSGGATLGAGWLVLASNARVVSNAGYLHLNWDNGLPVAIGSSAASPGRLGGTAGWQVDDTLNVITTTTTGYPVAGNANCSLTVGGLIQRIASSRRYKKEIEPLAVDLEAVLGLQPRRFKFKHRFENIDGLIVELDRDEAPWNTGFIAEEAHDLGLVDWVEYTDDGEIEGFHYVNFIAAHQAVLQDHQARIAELEAKNESLEARLARLEKIVAKLPPGLTK